MAQNYTVSTISHSPDPPDCGDYLSQIGYEIVSIFDKARSWDPALSANDLIIRTHEEYILIQNYRHLCKLQAETSMKSLLDQIKTHENHVFDVRNANKKPTSSKLFGSKKS